MAGGGQPRAGLSSFKVLGWKSQAATLEGRLRSGYGMLSLVALGMNPLFLLETWRLKRLGQ